MKNLTIFTLLSTMLMLNACKKEVSLEPRKLTNINIVNAAVGAGAIKVNYLNKSINWASYIGSDGIINFGANKVYSISAPSMSYRLEIVPALDTVKSIFKGNVNLEHGIFTLYLAGNPLKYDTLLVREKQLTYSTDSTMRLRFVNLISNSTPVNLFLSSTPSISEFSNVTYKALTHFKSYNVKSTVPNSYFNFQAKSGSTILATYSLTTANLTSSRNRNVTLILRGQIGGTGTDAPAIFLVQNY